MNKVLSLFLFVLFCSCTKKYQSRVTQNSDQLRDVFVEANRKMVNNEEDKIDSLLSLSYVPFIKDSTGIRIFISSSSQSSSIFPNNGDDVLIAYNCIIFDNTNAILDDFFIDTLGFKIGYSKQMRGLNYAIKLLKVGDRAKIIIPSYLGFGMSGYGKTVPPYSTLLLNVKLLNIKE